MDAEQDTMHSHDDKNGVYISAETLAFVSFGMGIFTIIFLINFSLCIYNCITLKTKYSKHGYKLRTFETDLEE